MRLSEIILLLITSLLIFTCGDSSSPEISLDSSMQYPLTVGNQWSYISSYTYTNFSGDRPSSFQDRTEKLMVTVNQQVTLNNTSVFELEEEPIESSYPYVMKQLKYLQNQSNGLIEIAHENSSYSCIPKLHSQHYFTYMGKDFNTINELFSSIENIGLRSLYKTDSVIINETPRMVYSYPFEVGNEWNYVTHNTGRKINRKVIGEERVSTNTGEFDCYKIQWLMDLLNDEGWDENLIYYDYVSAKGLIKREIIIKDVLFATPEDPDGDGNTCDIRQEIKLVDINF